MMRGKTDYFPIHAELLRELYVKQRLSTLDIGRKLGCSKKTVRLRLLEHAFKLRPLKQALAISKTHGRNVKQGRGEKALGWKGGRRRNCGYVMIFCPDHPLAGVTGYVMEHRLIMEAHIGRYLRDDEEVHHRNEIRSDNRLENLQLMTKSEHMAHHARERAEQGRLGFQIGSQKKCKSKAKEGSTNEQ